MPAVSFGIMTAPMQVDYDDVVRVWQEADTIAAIDHAWLFDHLMPIGGDPGGPIFEGWTLLSALAALTERLRVGVLVTSNRFRPPAMLAKIAATVDVVAHGRLDFGIGAGSRPSHPIARREYDANGMAYDNAADAVASLAEACTIIRRLWSDTDRSTSLVTTIASPARFATPNPSSGRIHRSSSAAVQRRRCAWSPSTPTCGTCPAARPPTLSSEAHCSTVCASRSAVTQARSPVQCSCPQRTTTRWRRVMQSSRRPTPASGTSSSG